MKPSRLLLITALAVACSSNLAAAASSSRVVKLVHKLGDAPAVKNYLGALGYKARGGVSRDYAERMMNQGRTLPAFSSSFRNSLGTFPFTMVGNPPASGRSVALKSVIVPLQFDFYGFGAGGDVSTSFDPSPAVKNILGSPMFNSAQWPGGLTGQFVDAMQRAAFWNSMDSKHSWHVLMGQPEVYETVKIEVAPEVGTLSQLPDGTYIGDVLIDFIDSQENTIMEFLGLPPDTLVIFVSDMVTAEALGYHSAGTELDPANANAASLRTYLFTSWLDPAEVDPLFADVSTFNHELAEWANDPFINNVVPIWAYPPASDPRTQCSGSQALEVGDPQGNGPTYDDYPTVVVPLKGVKYHLQQLVLWQWFTDLPSNALNGWYSFPDPGSLTAPAVYCN